jgi:hypothetical protein
VGEALEAEWRENDRLAHNEVQGDRFEGLIRPHNLGKVGEANHNAALVRGDVRISELRRKPFEPKVVGEGVEAERTSLFDNVVKMERNSPEMKKSVLAHPTRPTIKRTSFHDRLFQNAEATIYQIPSFALTVLLCRALFCLREIKALERSHRQQSFRAESVRVKKLLNLQHDRNCDITSFISLIE